MQETRLFSSTQIVWLQLHGKTDERFVQCAFRAFRDVLGIKPVLTPSQFLDQVMFFGIKSIGVLAMKFSLL